MPFARHHDGDTDDKLAHLLSSQGELRMKCQFGTYQKLFERGAIFSVVFGGWQAVSHILVVDDASAVLNLVRRERSRNRIMLS